jgi:hypothetical protein
MPCQLQQFGLGDMLRCSLGLRKVAAGAPTMEDAARRLCSFLYEELRTERGEPACPLVRFYKTHPYLTLPPEVRRFVQRLGASEPPLTTRCLTLLATVGERAEWNDRRRSRGHQAIPLVSTEMIERAPMIAQLIRAFGLELSDVVRPSSEVVHELEGKTYGVFHVLEAAKSPHIPAQREFVEPYGIRSAVGFGGTLPDGELFAIILFARVVVEDHVAQRFRNLALDVKSALLRHREAAVFEARE